MNINDVYARTVGDILSWLCYISENSDSIEVDGSREQIKRVAC